MSTSVKLTPKTFLGDRRGNVAMLFGLMAIPVFGIIGTAIDYSRAAKAKQEMQALVDGAALAATSEYTKSGDAAAATNRLRTFVQDGLNKHNLELLPPPQPGQPEPQLDSGPNKVLLQNGEFDGETATVRPKLTTRVETTILALLDQPYFEVEAAAKAGLAGKKLELSMMLDITGSMCDSGSSCSSGTKLNAMKSAANDLVDIVFTGNGANTRIAVVPFSTSVNLGSFAGAATGQPATTTYTYACGHKNRSTCTGTQYRTNCVAERNISGAARYEDDAPASGKYSTALWTTSSSASCSPGASASVLPLTNTRTAIESKINGLQATGGTAGHIGTAWAWYAISDKWASFWGAASAPEPVNPKLLKAAVLMTDGEYNNCGGGNSCSNSDEQALSFCTNMKAQGIRVFTVGFAIGSDSPARTMLMNCASPGDYHFPYSSQDMREAFQSIGNALMAGTAGPVLAN